MKLFCLPKFITENGQDIRNVNVQSQLQTSVYVLILTSAVQHKTQKKKPTKDVIDIVLTHSSGNSPHRRLSVPVQLAKDIETHAGREMGSVV